ncbi:MAG TPA: hypothetical protein VM869_29270, partial [Enhygromyxa sp.]|nr:hypothetical protein [Enhygromyxa sp.]
METASVSSEGHGPHPGPRVRECAALVVVWSSEEPARIGEIMLPDPELEPRAGWVFGRGDEGGVRLPLLRQRPGTNHATPPLTSSKISREQLRIRTGPAGSLMIENIGRRKLLLDGREVTRPVHVREGAVLELRGCLMLLVARRPIELPRFELPPELQPAFGCADDFGVVGESPPAWALRGRLWFAAQRDVHVLV